MQGKLEKGVIFLFFLAALLPACKPFPISPTQAPSEILSVQMTPALLHWQPRLTECAETLTDMNISLNIIPPDNLVIDNANLTLRYGSKKQDEANVSVVGYERLVIVLNPENPITEISLEDLRSIFLGEISLRSKIGGGNHAEEQEEIIPIRFEDNHDLSHALSDALGLENGITDQAFTVSTHEAMVQAILDHPGGIGYLLESQLNNDLTGVDVLGQGQTIIEFEFPILAITQSEPTGSLYQLLLCLQSEN